MDDLKRAEIERRMKASTPGTWRGWERGVRKGLIFAGPHQIATAFAQRDIRFIAHAHQDVPALLNRIEQLERAAIHMDDVAVVCGLCFARSEHRPSGAPRRLVHSLECPMRGGRR